MDVPGLKADNRQEEFGYLVIPVGKEVIKDYWACIEFPKNQLELHTGRRQSHLSIRKAKNHNELKYIRYVKTHEFIKILKKC